MKLIGIIFGVWLVSGVFAGIIGVVAALYFGVAIDDDGMTILTLIWMVIFFTSIWIYSKKK